MSTDQLPGNPNTDLSSGSDLDAAAAHSQIHTRLHQLRVATGMTQTEVARAHDWSVSKVGRIEKGHVRVSRSDLLALLDDYGVTDHVARETLLQLARTARRPMPFTGYRDVLGPESIRLLRYEASAVHIRDLAMTVLPDLLQTPDYSRALISSILGTDEATTERFATCIADRQRHAQRARPPHLTFLVGEDALRRPVGVPPPGGG